MAVVTVKSQAITNRDSSPAVINDAAHSAAGLRGFIASAAIANGDSVGSKYILGQIPSNAVIHSVLVSTSADIGTTTTADVGIYQTTANGGAVVDVDLFDDALSLKDGQITNSEILFSGAITMANSYKKLYEHLGLSSDPARAYDLVLTLDGAADGAGSVTVKVIYAI